MNRTIGLISANYAMPGYDTLTEERPAASLPFGGRFPSPMHSRQI